MLTWGGAIPALPTPAPPWFSSSGGNRCGGEDVDEAPEIPAVEVVLLDEVVPVAVLPATEGGAVLLLWLLLLSFALTADAPLFGLVVVAVFPSAIAVMLVIS